ncbi:hypothetical protein THASP1DRAFT_33425 [Thamnocephalis sphaerospora]|uniref:HbrB-like-domain-containing protein n=1 Tax=Thamnocephalis sphaerospora TaxID=78915 RepID=A0A4P9XGM6_9FUNG|nr:hypothetical protein THASP1DRAFT_33425 [Thamnocephalis sphaerospora]|eukprot:RKP04772.1 hypothetical protein THASP1DRAFT_33425 [Thamnocephalis sphaerospora]
MYLEDHPEVFPSGLVMDDEQPIEFPHRCTESGPGATSTADGAPTDAAARSEHIAAVHRRRANRATQRARAAGGERTSLPATFLLPAGVSFAAPLSSTSAAAPSNAARERASSESTPPATVTIPSLPLRRLSVLETPVTDNTVTGMRSTLRLLRARNSIFSLQTSSGEKQKKSTKKKPRPNLHVDTTARARRETVLNTLSEACGGGDLFHCFTPTSLTPLYERRGSSMIQPAGLRNRRASEIYLHSSSSRQRLRRASEQSLASRREPIGPKSALSVPNLNAAMQRSPNSPSGLRFCGDVSALSGHSGTERLSTIADDSESESLTGAESSTFDLEAALEADPLDPEYVMRDVLTAASELSAPDEWKEVCMRLLALFNDESVDTCLEDLAAIVRRCAGKRQLLNLRNDLDLFVEAGMYALHYRLTGLNGHMLLAQLAQLWREFYSCILSYVEAAMKGLRGLSVRDTMLIGFRDSVFLPLADKVIDVFCLMRPDDTELDRHDAACIIQMCGLLINVSHQSPRREPMLAVWRRLTSHWHTSGLGTSSRLSCRAIPPYA